MWGFFVLGPSWPDTFQPFMYQRVVHAFRVGIDLWRPALLSHLVDAALILAIMVLPFITAISVDVFKTLPPVLKWPLWRVCTTWEGSPQRGHSLYRVGVIGGIMLCSGSLALGDTMR